MRGHRLVARVLQFQFAQLGFDTAHMADTTEPVQIVQMMAGAARSRCATPPLAGSAARRAAGLIDPVQIQQCTDLPEQRRSRSA